MRHLEVRIGITLLLTLATAQAMVADTVPPAAAQIELAVLAAPASMRDGAGVLGYDQKVVLVTLREAQNDLLCLADDPTRDGFQAACYHVGLEPFMARGRALRREGVTDSKARREQRWREIEAGTLDIPEQPTTLHILEGDYLDDGKVVNPYQRWVIYVPYATADSTGLSTTPSESQPWLMVPGKPSAHIMITPPRPKASE